MPPLPFGESGARFQKRESSCVLCGGTRENRAGVSRICYFGGRWSNPMHKMGERRCHTKIRLHSGTERQKRGPSQSQSKNRGSRAAPPSSSIRLEGGRIPLCLGTIATFPCWAVSPGRRRRRPSNGHESPPEKEKEKSKERACTRHTPAPLPPGDRTYNLLGGIPQCTDRSSSMHIFAPCKLKRTSDMKTDKIQKRRQGKKA